MVNDLFDWITIALYNKFGDDYKYYVEEVEQNTSKPCFVVGALEPIVRRQSPVRYDRVFPIVIYYFTDKDSTSQAKRDCYDVAEKLLEALEEINNTEGDVLIRGYNISWEIVEGVLEFFINYRFYTYREVESEVMEDGFYNGVQVNESNN